MKQYKKIEIPERKTIALVAHDKKKDELFAWVSKNLDKLKKHNLIGTGTTASIIKDKFNLDIKPFLSGPMGGDQMIGSEIAKNKIDILIFFWDPLTAQPHDPDVKALLRIAVLYDTVVCMSPTNCDYVFESPLINKKYDKYILNTDYILEERKNSLE